MLEINKPEKVISDHAFEPSTCYPDGEGCAYIVDGAQWTMMDPNRCRRAERDHAETKRTK